MRVYAKIRNILATHMELLLEFEKFERKLADHDEKIMILLEYIKQFEQIKQQESDQKKRSRIGYKQSNKK